MHIVSSFIVSFLSWYFLGGKVGLNVFVLFLLYLPTIRQLNCSNHILCNSLRETSVLLFRSLTQFYQQFSDLNVRFLKNID